jgi:hypothetical protein
MKKQDLKKLALLGLAGGALVAAQAEAVPQTPQRTGRQIAQTCSGPGGCPGTTNSNSNPGTQAPKANAVAPAKTNGNFVSELNPEAKSMYDSMDAEGKALVQKLAEQTCAGQNDCKGLNSCKSDKNSCQGQGACQGQSKGPFKDKNQAVKVANQHMQQKRAKMNNSMQNQRTNTQYRPNYR